MIKLDTNKILVPYDFSATADKALSHAAAIAKNGKGELLLFYARKKSTARSLTHSVSELRQMAEESSQYEKKLEDVAKAITGKYGISVKVHVGLGRTVPEISRIAEKKKAGLIVMGTDGSDSVSNLFSGSNSNKVISRSGIPVLTVRDEPVNEGFTKILLPIDLSEHNRQKVIIAIQIARVFRSAIHLLGVLAAHHEDDEARLRAILHQVKKRIEEERLPVEQELMHTSEAVKRTLACAKRVKANLIIAMTDQETGTEGLFSPSFDQELVNESHIPVLSVPPEIHDENIAQTSIGGL